MVILLPEKAIDRSQLPKKLESRSTRMRVCALALRAAIVLRFSDPENDDQLVPVVRRQCLNTPEARSALSRSDRRCQRPAGSF
jgi:hypothetical protein